MVKIGIDHVKNVSTFLIETERVTRVVSSCCWPIPTIGFKSFQSEPPSGAIADISRSLTPPVKQRSTCCSKDSSAQSLLPTQEEFSGRLAKLDNRPRSHVGLCTRFVALTGLRINEARQVEWQDIQESGIFVRAEIAA